MLGEREGEVVPESLAGGSKNRWGTVGLTDEHRENMDSEAFLFQEQEEVPVPLPAEEEGVEEGPGQGGGGGGQGAGGGQEQEAGELLQYPFDETSLVMEEFLLASPRLSREHFDCPVHDLALPPGGGGGPAGPPC